MDTTEDTLFFGLDNYESTSTLTNLANGNVVRIEHNGVAHDVKSGRGIPGIRRGLDQGRAVGGDRGRLAYFRLVRLARSAARSITLLL